MSHKTTKPATRRQELHWPPSIRRKVERFAKRERRSLSQATVILIERGLASMEQPSNGN